jgi:hypothetical protein
MKKFRLLFSTLAVSGLLFSGCSKDENAPAASSAPASDGGSVTMEAMGPNVEVYDLFAPGTTNRVGQVFFSKGGQKTQVTVRLNSTANGASHPAHIHYNSVAQTGGIAATLTNVKGSSGRSSTNLTQLDDGTSMTWDQFNDFNGYVNVHLSASQLNVIIAQGNIGSNAIPSPPSDN